MAICYPSLFISCFRYKLLVSIGVRLIGSFSCRSLFLLSGVCTLSVVFPLLHFATLALVVYGVGNWGCGAFNGDKLVKAVVQLLACSAGNVIQVRKGMVWDSGAGLVG